MSRRPVVGIVTAMLLSLIGAVVILFTDFGYLYWRTGSYGYYVHHYEWINIGHPIGGPFIGIMVGLLILISITQLVALVSKEAGSSVVPYLISIGLLMLAFLLELAGFIAFTIDVSTSDYGYWSYEAACYAGVIAPLGVLITTLISLVLVIKRKKRRSSKEE